MKSSTYYLLFIIIVMIGIFSPKDLFDSGFSFSVFAITTSIVLYILAITSRDIEFLIIDELVLRSLVGVSGIGFLTVAIIIFTRSVPVGILYFYEIRAIAGLQFLTIYLIMRYHIAK